MSRHVLAGLIALLWVLVVLSACASNAETPAEDGDTASSDGDTDGDTDADEELPALTGAGACEDPFVHHDVAEGIQILDGGGDIADFANVTTAAVCGDAASEDGDLDDEVETSPRATTGAGPEVVVKIHLEEGDRLSATFLGEDYDALIMLRQNLCSGGEGCTALSDDMGVGQIESLTAVASTVGNYYLIFDSNDPQPTGLFSYHIEIKSAGAAAGAGDGAVGAACESGNECMTGYCLTTEGLAILVGGGDVTVPNGYCTAILCAVDGSDGACPAESGGECVSLYAFAGDILGNKGLCLDLCEVDSDCRIEDDMRCFDPQEYVEQGLMEQAVKDQYFSEKKACLANDIIQAGAEILMGMYL